VRSIFIEHVVLKFYKAKLRNRLQWIKFKFKINSIWLKLSIFYFNKIYWLTKNQKVILLFILYRKTFTLLLNITKSDVYQQACLTAHNLKKYHIHFPKISIIFSSIFLYLAFKRFYNNSYSIIHIKILIIEVLKCKGPEAHFENYNLFKKIISIKIKAVSVFSLTQHCSLSNKKFRLGKNYVINLYNPA